MAAYTCEKCGHMMIDDQLREEAKYSVLVSDLHGLVEEWREHENVCWFEQYQMGLSDCADQLEGVMNDRISQKKKPPCPKCIEKSRLLGEQWRRHTSDIRSLIGDLKTREFLDREDCINHLERILKRW